VVAAPAHRPRAPLRLLAPPGVRAVEERLLEVLRRRDIDVEPCALADVHDDAKPSRGIVLAGDRPADVVPFVKALRGDPRTALLPLAAYVSELEPAGGSPLACGFVDPSWQLYVDAIVPGVASPEEIHAAMLRIFRIAMACAVLEAPGGGGPDARRQLAILRYLATRELPALEPRRNPQAPLGWAWPPLDLLAAGDPSDDLAALCRAGLLRRSFHDRIHVCPTCQDARLAFREVCGACQSPNVRRGEALHHYRCGHVACEDRFRRGADLVCPACEGRLRHVGIDYERPTGLLFCDACGVSDGEGITRARCLACGAVSTPEAVGERVIWTYEITAEGQAAARAGDVRARRAT
jgi:hypothetical protein